MTITKKNKTGFARTAFTGAVMGTLAATTPLTISQLANKAATYAEKAFDHQLVTATIFTGTMMTSAICTGLLYLGLELALPASQRVKDKIERKVMAPAFILGVMLATTTTIRAENEKKIVTAPKIPVTTQKDSIQHPALISFK